MGLKMRTLPIQGRRGIAIMAKHAIPRWITLPSQPCKKAGPGLAFPFTLRATPSVDMVDDQKLISGFTTTCTTGGCASVCQKHVLASLATPCASALTRYLRVAFLVSTGTSSMNFWVGVAPSFLCLAGTQTTARSKTITTPLLKVKVFSGRWVRSGTARTSLHAYHFNTTNWLELCRSDNGA